MKYIGLLTSRCRAETQYEDYVTFWCKDMELLRSFWKKQDCEKKKKHEKTEATVPCSAVRSGRETEEIGTGEIIFHAEEAKSQGSQSEQTEYMENLRVALSLLRTN